MEVHYPKYVLYGLLIAASWLISCLLHFQFIHLSLFASSPHDSPPPLIALPLSVSTALDASFQRPARSTIAEQDGALRRLSSAAASPSCEGRLVYMVDVPSRFDVLRDCVQGSPLFQDEYSMCSLMANAGMGPVFPPATGDGSDGDTGVIPNTGWYNTDQYALEVIVHNRMSQYECLTDDPAAATAVYVPYYPALEVEQHRCGFNASVRNGPSTEFLRWLSSRPHWAAFRGRDHFMVAAKTTWMFRHNELDGDPGAERVCGNNFLERPESGNMTVLTYESYVWARRDFAVPYPSYFHPTSAHAVAAWQARARAAHRPRLFAFAGARRAKGVLAIRDRIIDSCASSSRCGLVDCSHGFEGFLTCHSPRRIISVFASSRFCLQPPGDSSMRRSMVDSIMAGCIPVFFHDESTFKKQYRWHHPDPAGGGDRRYWVLIDPDEVLEGKVDIEEVLARYTDQDVAAMREEVIKMIPRFLYKDPRVNFLGGMRDAFDIAFDEVMARIRRIKNGEDLGWPVLDDDMVAPKNSS